MSVLPRWNDQFTTDPTSDPAYQLIGTHTYDGVGDTLSQEGVGPNLTLLNSNNSFGIVEIDALWVDQSFSFTSTGKAYILAFGYYFVISRDYHQVFPETETGWINQSSGGILSVPNELYRGDGLRNTRTRVKMISTPLGVDLFLNDVFTTRLDPASNIGNVVVGGGGTEGQRNIIYSIEVKSDASLPLQPTITQPAPAGALPASDGPILVDVPESRLYLDLGASYTGMSDIANVVYDPGGSAVAMTEDTGVPDRSGGTNGDFYLEIPNRGVASDWRLVFKEDFVTTNSVAVSDDVDFDILPGPSTQNALIVEEGDLHCVVEKSTQQDFVEPFDSSIVADNFINDIDPRPTNNLILPNSSNFSTHNTGVDGNTYVTRQPADLFNDNWGSIGDTITTGSASIPLIIDIDLGKVRNITNLFCLAFTSSNIVTSVDIYSKDTPFSGAGVQGNLEVDSHPLYRNITTGQLIAEFLKNVPAQFNITTRYLRLQANGDDLTGGGPDYTWGRQFYLFGTDIISINSDDDNAQFQHEPGTGGGFVAYPGAGVTQGDGQVEVTLPTEMEVEAGNETDFFRITFKPDITD